MASVSVDGIKATDLVSCFYPPAPTRVAVVLKDKRLGYPPRGWELSALYTSVTLTTKSADWEISFRGEQSGNVT